MQTTGGGATPYRRRRPERTLLYRTVSAHLETWLALRRSACDDTDVVPTNVEREFRRYLECGILAHGFARARCPRCGHDFLIAFSCKGRGVCPSCNTRRMVEAAAHLTDHVLPALPLRQWVLSVPKRLRYFLERDPALQGVALRLFLGAVEQCLRAHCPGCGTHARIGAIAFIHRFGSALNAHLHFHCVVIDGVFAATPTRGAVFHPANAIDSRALATVQAKVRRRLLASFARRGLLAQDDTQAMAHWAHDGGFSIDGSVRIEAADRAGRERLLRCCARPTFALERLRELDAEHLVYEGAKPGSGGTSLRLTPLELLERLAALVPPPRVHRHRNYGVLAPNAPLHQAVTAMALVAHRHRSGIGHLRNRHRSEPLATPGRSSSRASTKSFRCCVRFAQPRCASSPLSPNPARYARSLPTSASRSVHPPLPRLAARRCGTCPMPRATNSTPTPSPHRPSNSINASPGNGDPSAREGELAPSAPTPPRDAHRGGLNAPNAFQSQHFATVSDHPIPALTGATCP